MKRKHKNIILAVFISLYIFICCGDEKESSKTQDEDVNTRMRDDYGVNIVPESIDEDKRTELIEISRMSIKNEWSEDEVLCPKDNPFSKIKRGIFVTLKKNGDLRGCMGTIQPHGDVVTEVVNLSKTAAFKDPRFPPLRQDEYNDLDIEISILSPLEKIENPTDFILGEDGIVLEYKGRTGVLLPQVVENDEEWTRQKFLDIVSLKAGLGINGWNRYPVEIKKFRCVIID